jgi:hypothetical protein
MPGSVLYGSINTPIHAFYSSGLIQTKNNVPNLLFTETGFGLDLSESQPLFGALDGFQDDINGRLGNFSTRDWDASIVGTKRGIFDQIFQTIQPGDQLVNVFFRRNAVMLHEKFDHRIETDCFPLPSWHGSLLGKWYFNC